MKIFARMMKDVLAASQEQHVFGTEKHAGEEEQEDEEVNEDEAEQENEDK